MSTPSNTLFMRLEGPLQAWGDASKMVIRRTLEAPSKSGVLGLICCGMGLSRAQAIAWLASLSTLRLGVRVDRPGTRWWDYHTVGAGYGILTGAGPVKRTASTDEYETLVSRREYLCDASFLVALQGEPELVRQAKESVCNPVWPPFLGRKSCPPGVPIFAGEGQFPDLLTALAGQPWRPRCERERGAARGEARLPCLVEWLPSAEEPAAPADAEVWHDVPISLEPPVHQPRLVQRTRVKAEIGEALQHRAPAAPRPQASYLNAEYGRARAARLAADRGLCVFCKAPAATVQHVTYRRAGGDEAQEDLRSLCRLCHDAVTMIEYGLGMGLDRIDPQEPRWREAIIAKRQEIVSFRSLATRRRHLAAEEVE